MNTDRTQLKGRIARRTLWRFAQPLTLLHPQTLFSCACPRAYPVRLFLVFIVAGAFLFSSDSSIARPRGNDRSIDELRRAFRQPPQDAKIMMRWWWFGPSITKSEIEREMRLMKEGGIGGFEVQPVYPLALDDESNGVRTRAFLSNEFLGLLRFAADKAHELGMRMDLTLGSGWPYGGPTVPISQAAGRLRVERLKLTAGVARVKVPAIGTGEKLLAVFLAKFDGQSIASGGLRELTQINNGAVHLPDSIEQGSEVLFFIASRTGMQVKRPAIGGEGFVLDHLDRGAVESYLRNVGDRLMTAFGSNRPYAIFCDSLEVYASDWTGDFLQEFNKRRGYDLRPQLPALIADIGPRTASIRRDWGRTLTELLEERFLAPVRDWSHKNGTLFRVQCYGSPAAAPSSNAFADLSEGEGSQWKMLTATRWASSANHLYDRNVTSSETWTWLHSPSFRATPLDMKAEADRHFLQGVNQLIGHGWPSTSAAAEYPGWRFYAAGAFNENNPWWIVMPDLAAYLQRVSFMLRQGRPANDVAIYLPCDDAWARFSNGNVSLIEVLREIVGPNVIPAILDSGHNFDLIDSRMIESQSSSRDGILESNNYSAIILPNVETISAAGLKRLEHFARSGGKVIVVGNRAPLMNTPGNVDAQATDPGRALFESAQFVSAGSDQLISALTRSVRPDVALSPSLPDIGFIRRRTPDAEIYFLVNTANTTQRTIATFRVQYLEPEWWDAMTGSIEPAVVKARSQAGVSIALDLEPYGSRVLVFSRAERPVEALAVENPSSLLDLSTGWKVSFGDALQAVEMNTLHSWTADESTRYYSGIATYEKTFTLPDSSLKAGSRVRLDLGEAVPEVESNNRRANGMQAWLAAPVREAAVIYVNGKRAGSVWCPPYSLDVTSLLKVGENKLRIAVANTAINYMAGHALPDYKLLNLRYGERFQPQDMDKVQPAPSGLLGPVKLVILSKAGA